MLRPNPQEVAWVFKVPLGDLLNDAIPHLEIIPQSPRPVLSAPIETLSNRIYAPTAAVLYQFREVALLGKPTRVAEFEQPVFAWR